MQASGHEMMDHTPTHDAHYFLTSLPTDYYLNHPGVQRISGNKIELKHADVDISKAKRSGYVNINGNVVTSTSGIFASFLKTDCYLYFPSINELVFIDDYHGWIDEDTVIVDDFWENEINLGTYQNIQFYNFDVNNVHLTLDAIKALAEETLRLSDYYNLERPYTWIQPGGYFPHVYSDEVKQACGDELGYKSAGVFANPSLKVFNEYNPNNDRQFGMNWGDFKLDTQTLEECKQVIADMIAKHRVAIGSSHFQRTGDLGGWQGFLNLNDQLIQWCVANNIPIRTYSEWADVLYNQTPDPNENIIPRLNVDLDANNIPDGYNTGAYLRKTDGYPNISDFCYSISWIGQMCSISNLGGIEKGENNFEIWTKGAPGNFIEVAFKVGSQNLVYKFPAESSEWAKYNLAHSINGNTSLNIPTNVSLINVEIRCSNFSSGEVKISGMKLNKSSGVNDYLNVTPSNQFVVSSSGSTNFSVSSNLNWTVSDDASWLTVYPSSGSNNGIITVTYAENTNSVQRIGTISVVGGGINKTVTVTQAAAPSFLTITPTNRSVSYPAGNTTFSISSNVDWTVIDDANWINISPAYGSNTGIISTDYSANPYTYSRVSTLTISGGGIIKTVTITQEALPSNLTVSPAERNVSHIEGSTTFSVSSNITWTVEDNVDWLVISPTSASNDGTLTVTYTANMDTLQRVGTITVKGGGITRTVAVNQESAPYLEVTPADQYVGNEEGITTFIISSNRSWTIEDNAAWLTVTPTNGSNEGTLTITHSANTDTIQRIGTITVSGGGITRTITVTQESTPFLNVTPLDQYISYDEGSTTFIVASNRDWTTENNSNWITVDPISGMNHGTLTVTCTANTDTIPREETIVISGGGKSKSVIVRQKSAPYLEVIPSERFVSNVQGTVTFAVISNRNWTVSEELNWITLLTENDSSNSIITVQYTENTATIERVGIITVKSAEITRNVTITQAATNYLTVSPLQIGVSADSGFAKLFIESNISWNLNEDIDWVQLNKNSGSGSDSVILKYQSNTTVNPRTAIITISGDSIFEEIKVNQKAGEAQLVVVPNNNVVGADSGRININIESNTSWYIQNGTSWININPDFGTGNGSFSILYNANNDSLRRIGDLIVTADTLCVKYYLEQNGLDVFQITALVDSEESGITSGSGRYLSGSQAKITSIPNQGWKFKSWKEGDKVVSTDSIFSFLVSSPRTLIAVFEKVLVGINDDIEFADHFELFQNYPNPFNPSTKIRYSVPSILNIQTVRVILKIVNILGNEIVTLVNQEQNPGFHEVEWHAENFPSGIYFYQIKVRDFISTKKMILLK
jgi:hypothetical protein